MNASPVIYAVDGSSTRMVDGTEMDDGVVDAVDDQEVFDLIRQVRDPEHPLSLEELRVVQKEHVFVDHGRIPWIRVEFTPTIPHCSMATLIGLCIKTRLVQSLPFYYRIDVMVRPGTHISEHAINKQLRDKERVAAAMENEQLMEVVRGCVFNR